MSKQTFYEEIDDLCNKYGIDVEYSEHSGLSFKEPTIRLKTEAVGPMGTRIMVDQFVGAGSGRINHYVWATNSKEPGMWRPMTQKNAKYILECLGKDKQK